MYDNLLERHNILIVSNQKFHKCYQQLRNILYVITNSKGQVIMKQCGRGRQSMETWFDNVINNTNNSYNITNYTKFIKSIDPRDTNPIRNIFQGFTALDYAILTKNADNVKKYLSDEILIPTNNAQLVKVHTVINDNGIEVEVPPNTSCLQLATMLNFTEGIQLILKHITNTSSIQSIFFQNRNKNNENNLDIILYNITNTILDIIRQFPIILEHELQQSLQKDNILEKLIRKQRLSGLHFIYQLAAPTNCDQMLQSKIAEASLKKYNGSDIKQIVQMQPNNDTQEHKNIEMICTALYKRSYYFAKQQVMQGTDTQTWEALLNQ